MPSARTSALTEVYSAPVPFSRAAVLLAAGLVAAALIAHLSAQSQSQRAPTETRPVWTPEDSEKTWGNVSPDGRYLPYGNGADLNLYVRDIQKNVSRRLTTRPPLGGPDVGVPGDDVWAFSRDGSLLAYSWAIEGREELRTVDMRETNPQPKTVLADPDIRFATAWAWTPDVKQIVVGIWRQRRQESELGVIEITTGNLRVLTRVPTAAGNNQGGVTISRDGRFIAYSPRQQGSQARDVILLPIAGGAPIPLLATPDDDQQIGWSPDGRELAFARTVDGSRSIHAVGVNSDGTPGAIRLLAQEIAYDTPYGLTSDGSFLFSREGGSTHWTARLSSIDLQTGRVLERARDMTSSFGELQPDNWSRDGTRLALQTAFGEALADHHMVIRNSSTGVLEKIQTKVQIFNRLWWAGDGRSLMTLGVLTPQRIGLIRVDTITGAATEIIQPIQSMHAVSRDGRAIVEQAKQDGSGEVSLIEVNSTGQSRVLHSWTGGESGRQSAAVDEEARVLFYRTPDRAAAASHRLITRDLLTGRETVLVPSGTIGKVTSAAGGRYVHTSIDGRPVLVPASGGKAIDIPLVAGAAPEILAWAADGRAFLGRTLSRAPMPGRPNRDVVAARYWWIPIDGRSPRSIDAGIGPYAASFVVHGTQIAFTERSGAVYQPTQVLMLPRLFDASRRTEAVK